MKRFSQLAVPYIAWAVMMLILPMGLIALYSVTEQGNSIISFTFTLEHYAKFFTDPDFLIVLWRSLLIALKTTVICLLLGYPIAYFISRSSEKIQNLLVLVITIPMWINMLVRTYAWIGLLSEGGLIQRLLSLIGLGSGELLYTEGADAAWHGVQFPAVYGAADQYVTLQDGSFPAGGKLRSGSKSAPDLCQGDASDVTAGCHQRHYARLSAGSQLVFIPKLLGGGQYFLIGNLIENQFITVGEWNFGSAISMIMAVIMMLLMMAVRRVEIRNNGGKEE